MIGVTMGEDQHFDVVYSLVLEMGDYGRSS